MARRLPIFLLIDVSESMAGEETRSVEKAVNAITDQLKANPYALETVHISVIAFAGKAKTLSQLSDLMRFVPPRLPTGGGTNLGNALSHLMVEIDAQVRKTTNNQRGDWKSIIFLITDGASTDSVSNSIAKWKREYRNRAFIVAVSIGGQAKLDDLRDLTEEIVIFDDTKPQAFDKFARWISESVSMASVGLADGETANLQLAELDNETLQRPEESSVGSVDERYVVLVGQCSTNKVPYLLKYSRDAQASSYTLKETLTLTSDYFEFTAQSKTDQIISTNNLNGLPSCPSCNNDASFSLCDCGGLLCSKFDGREYMCGWCGDSSTYVQASGDLSSKRAQG